jgi:hypothetical protein
MKALMGTVHRLIMEHGVEAARNAAETKSERQAIDAAAAIMVEEESRLGITHAGFAMTALPHRRIEEPFWERSGYQTILQVESGRLPGGKLVGVPYGSLARMILLYLQTEAIRTNSPEVELGRSMRAWMVRMSLADGGRTYKLVTEQARKISACRLTFFAQRGGLEMRQNGMFVRDAISLSGVIDDTQPTLWQDRVRLDDGFWASLREHPVPVREEALRAIGARSLALDVYIWLAYRLHSLAKPMPVSWTALHAQFGAGFQLVRKIKPSLTDALRLTLAVYPEARVDVEPSGFVLHPSPPAVPRAEAKRIGLRYC